MKYSVYGVAHLVGEDLCRPMAAWRILSGCSVYGVAHLVGEGLCWAMAVYRGPCSCKFRGSMPLQMFEA